MIIAELKMILIIVDYT